MDARRIGRQGSAVCPLGFGAFKIGRNQGTKYAQGYELPDERAVAQLLNGLLDLGVNYIDTAPAYGLSEARIGQAIATRRDEFVLSTKVGELFEHGQSTFDYTRAGIEQSVDRSLRRLQTDVLDFVFIHSNGNDREILENSDAVAALHDLRAAGKTRGIGLSGKTAAGAEAALAWADAIMVEYHSLDRSHEAVIAAAGGAGIGVVVKKGLASGSLDPAEALAFVLANPAVSAVVVGTLSLDHMRANLAALA